MYKELLTDEDWCYLKASIASIFFIIAKTDGKIDNKEKKSIDDIIANSHKLKSALAREVVQSIGQGEDLLSYFNKLNMSSKDILRTVGFILDNKLEPSDALSYKKHLIAIGVIIGNASGTLFDYKMSHEEMGTLREIGNLIGISVKDLEQTNIIFDIINSVND